MIRWRRDHRRELRAPAVIAALILSVTFVPAGVAMLFKGPVQEKHNIVLSAARRGYKPLLRFAPKARVALVAGAVALVLVCGVVAGRMGSEFVPSLNEGDLAVQALRIPATGLSQSLEFQKQIETRLMKFPEVATVFARTGTAEVATDPMPQNISDSYVMLKPRDQWPDPKKSKAEFTTEIEEALGQFPGNSFELSQPIQLRFNELISGVRSDFAVKLYGDDLATLLRSDSLIATALNGVQGAADVKVEQVSGLPVLSVQPKLEALARYGIALADVQETVATALGGIGKPTLVGRGAGNVGADHRIAHPGLRQCARCVGDFLRRAACADGWRARALVAGYSALDLGRCGLSCAVWRGGIHRTRDG